MLVEIGKALSFLLSILSLYPVVVSAFFAPGTHWQERLSLAAARVVVAACFCFASGLFFCRPMHAGSKGERLMRTLPVQMFCWTVMGMALLFVLSWYLETYFVPLMWRNQ